MGAVGNAIYAIHDKNCTECRKEIDKPHTRGKGKYPKWWKQIRKSTSCAADFYRTVVLVIFRKQLENWSAVNRQRDINRSTGREANRNRSEDNWKRSQITYCDDSISIINLIWLAIRRKSHEVKNTQKINKIFYGWYPELSALCISKWKQKYFTRQTQKNNLVL